MKSTKQILLDAANLLAEKGWCQRGYHNGARSCVMGAIAIASTGLLVHEHDGVEHRNVINAAETVAKFLGMADLPDLVLWNDEPGRTAEGVIAKLREVAESLV